jgi:hypothetical protein
MLGPSAGVLLERVQAIDLTLIIMNFVKGGGAKQRLNVFDRFDSVKYHVEAVRYGAPAPGSGRDHPRSIPMRLAR